MGLISDLLFTNKIGLFSKKALDANAKKALLINSNIANAETPGYKAVDIKPFEKELENAYKGKIKMSKTNPGHLGGGMDSLKNFTTDITVSKAPGRLDGNNVNLDKEVVKLMSASTKYNALLTARKARGKMISAAMENAR